MEFWSVTHTETLYGSNELILYGEKNCGTLLPPLNKNKKLIVIFCLAILTFFLKNLIYISQFKSGL